jgi:hypothetical protein
VRAKIIKLGIDTRQVVARFEQERQALALMDHPTSRGCWNAGATDRDPPTMSRHRPPVDRAAATCMFNCHPIAG